MSNLSKQRASIVQVQSDTRSTASIKSCINLETKKCQHTRTSCNRDYLHLDPTNPNSHRIHIDSTVHNHSYSTWHPSHPLARIFRALFMYTLCLADLLKSYAASQNVLVFHSFRFNNHCRFKSINIQSMRALSRVTGWF